MDDTNEERWTMKRGLKLFTIVMVLLALGAVGASAKGRSNQRLGLEFGNPNAVLIIRPASSIRITVWLRSVSYWRLMG
jgi:hypothetical protein